jgi:dolichol-phosphate mannosyltransferase
MITHRLRPTADPLVSIVLPVFNELAALETLVAQLERVLRLLDCRYEIIFVDDGSSDGSGEKLDELALGAPEIRVVHLARNFGHQAALQAGLVHAAGDAIIVMDSDLQDDPNSIPAFLEKWQAGYDVVYAVRENRKEGTIKRGLFYAFYRVLNAISNTPMPHDAGNFGLIDRSVAQQVMRLIERDRYFPGLRRWVGYRQTGVQVERLPRHDDHPRVSLLGLFRLAKTAIFSFSTLPLTMFYVIAALSAAAFCALVCFTFYQKLFTNLAVPGWTSILTTASFFGALNALGIGILGEYVMRIYDQVRARPLFIVGSTVNFGDSPRGRAGHASRKSVASGASADGPAMADQARNLEIGARQ